MSSLPPPRPRLPNRAALPGLLLALACAGPAPRQEEPPPWFDIAIESPGVYAVAWESLAEAAEGLGSLPSAELRLTNRGEAVPIWVEDGGDGRLDAGDHFEFVAEHLAGEGSYYSEYSVENVYRLRADRPEGARAEPAARGRRGSAAAGAGPAGPNPLRVREHIERDRMLLRFAAGRGEEPPEAWYWSRITHLQKRPFQVHLDLGDREPAAAAPTSLTIDLRGWSTQAEGHGSELPDHRLEVFWNEVPVGAGEWNGQERHRIELEELPAEAMRPKRNTLRLSVPQRRPAGRRDPLIDVVLLNWIEIEYPRLPQVGRDPSVIHLAAGAAGREIELRSQNPEVYLYTRGTRLAPEDLSVRRDAEGLRLAFAAPADSERLFVLPRRQLATPRAVRRSAPPSLTATDRQADYLILTHPSLRRAVEPLAEHHRRQGLAVEVIDIGRVYDDFHHGIQHPKAIRDFLAHAYHRWQEPAPRFVLLVGDASWDLRNEKVRDSNYVDWTYHPGQGQIWSKNASTAYEGARGAARNLIPTWRLATHEGHAASDNWLATVDGDDHVPDLAVGRFPVVTPEEVEAIVEKTLAYATAPEVGPWRRRLLWITNEEVFYQKYSDTIARKLDRRGFDSAKVYPSPREKNNAAHNAFLKSSFDEGSLLVNFIGHGGRYIWRTGPPDLSKNHDLFTLEDLDELRPNRRLPVVLSLTCYSAPFDHPSADSIGEKFLRLADRGAVAVLAASWRNNPNPVFSDLLMRELTRPGPIGEAILRAKGQIKNRNLALTYNLLGDPALEIARPSLELVLTAQAAEGDEEAGSALLAEIPDPTFRGRAIVDWLDASGEILHSQELPVAAPSFPLETPELAAPAHTVRVYAWNAERGIDGLGGLALGKGPRPRPGAGPARTARIHGTR